MKKLIFSLFYLLLANKFAVVLFLEQFFAPRYLPRQVRRWREFRGHLPLTIEIVILFLLVDGEGAEVEALKQRCHIVRKALASTVEDLFGPYRHISTWRHDKLLLAFFHQCFYCITPIHSLCKGLSVAGTPF